MKLKKLKKLLNYREYKKKLSQLNVAKVTKKINIIKNDIQKYRDYKLSISKYILDLKNNQMTLSSLSYTRSSFNTIINNKLIELEKYNEEFNSCISTLKSDTVKYKSVDKLYNISMLEYKNNIAIKDNKESDFY